MCFRFFLHLISFNDVESSPFEISGGPESPKCLVFANTEMVLDESNATYRIDSDVRFFSLGCTAHYPMDLSFDGRKPEGEEIAVSFTSTVKNTSVGSQITYQTDLALSANVVNAQLTGNYSIFSINNSNHRTSIYIFHNKNPPYLFRTSEASRINVNTGNPILTLPCRSTNFNSEVLLYKRSESKKIDQIGRNEFLSYDPKVGFTWNTSGLPIPKDFQKPGVAFICQTNSKNDSIEFTLGNFEDDINTDDVTENSLRIVISLFEDQTQVECYTTGGVGYLSNVQARNPRELSFRTGCALPGRTCARKRVGSGSLRGDRVLIQTAYSYGIAFCTEQESNLTATKEYFRGLDDNIYFNWEEARDSEALIQINAVNGTMVYSNMTYMFTCTFQSFIITQPVFYTLHFKNGSSVDYRAGVKPVYEITLFSDISQVGCSATPWNSSLLVNSSIDISLRDRRAPEFEIKETSVRMNLNASDQQLRCLANGDEPPHMYWEKDGTEIKDDDNMGFEVMSQPGYSGLHFPLVRHDHGGIYECFAQNSVGMASKKFYVQVTEPGPEGSNYGVTVGLPLGLLAVLFVTILASYVFFKYFHKNQLYLTSEEIEEFKGGVKGVNASADPEKQMENIQQGPYNSDYEIQSNQFQLDRTTILGSGQFGVVYKGLFNHEPIAVKTVRPHVEKTYLKALLSELKVMIYINGHKNIVHLLGANTEPLRKGVVYVFVELCTLGSLEGFLRSHQHNFINQITHQDTVEVRPRVYSNIRTGEDTMYTKELILWSFQISNAMEYLSRKKVIHGDLATRNVLLANRETAKITDFGLARKLYNYATYEKKNQEPLPWRWMAIESLRSLSFSTKSDVWSFGVTLWEIFTLGDVPYPGLSWSVDFVEQLQNNLRMTQPKNACSGIYDIMLDCWQKNPEDRPTFEFLFEYFSTYLSKFPGTED